MSISADGTASPPGLRERRRRQTRQEIADAAVSLFSLRGVDRTTVDDIAAAAGISPRTFFRYAATKEHAIFVDDQSLERLHAMVSADEQAHRSPFVAIETAHVRLLEEFDELSPAEQDRALRVRELILANESLLALALARDAEILEQLVSFVAEHDANDVTRMQARTLISAIGTAVRLALDEWARRAALGERVSTTRLYAEIRATFSAFFGTQGCTDSPLAGS